MNRALPIFAFILLTAFIGYGATQVIGSDDSVSTSDTTTTSSSTTSSSTAPTTTETTPATDGTSSTSEPEDPPITVGALFDGEGARSTRLLGSVLWDNTSARVCSALMESFPPQCGAPWMVIANPEGLRVELTSERTVKWTDSPAVLEGTFDGSRFVLDEQAELVVPTSADREMIEAFLDFAAAPGDEYFTKLPLAESVQLGLSSTSVTTVAARSLGDPQQWQMDVSEYAGFGGPFSALEMAERPVEITIGPHQRCAGPPVARLAGLDDHKQVSIQPSVIDSCIAWWTVDFFIDAEGRIDAVTLDLFGP